MSWLCGLVGEGISSSRCPAMHEREAKNMGIPLVYRIIDTNQWKGSVKNLPAIFHWLERFGFNGVNVTHPYKQAIIPLLDELSDAASAIGAVNTVIFKNENSLVIILIGLAMQPTLNRHFPTRP